MSDLFSLSPANATFIRAGLFTKMLGDVESLLTAINENPGEWSLNKLFDRLVAIHEEYSESDPVSPDNGSPS